MNMSLVPLWPLCINTKFHVDPHSLFMEPISTGKVNAAQLKEEIRGEEERERGQERERDIEGKKERRREGRREEHYIKI